VDRSFVERGPCPSTMSSMSEDEQGASRDSSPEGGEFTDTSPEAETMDRIALYFAGVYEFPDIPTLAQRWLEELAREGISAGWRKQSREYRYALRASKDELRSVRLENGQTVWLVFYPEGIEVLEDYPRTTLAILGALAALEGGEVGMAGMGHIRSALSSTGGPAEEALGELRHPDRLNEHQMLTFALVLLAFYRPDFDGLPPNEQRRLAAQVCERLDAVSKACRKLAETLEFGTVTPSRSLRSAVKDAARDVRLAELHDVHGINQGELGEIFGIEQTETDKVKRENQGVRKGIERARKLLNEALDEGWEEVAARRRSG
jgi:hypothetical protein